MAEKRKYGTTPVFFTAISTILGAVLFLRFGFAVGNLGFWGVVLLILLGHLVTIPTALALSEIATNKRVEGGGEYFVISRSFGLNIGSTIGITLYLSQAISIAFYIIAFTESFGFLFNFLETQFNINYFPRQVISIPAMLALSYIIIKKGSGMGMKALYVINAIILVVLVLFFLGSPVEASGDPSTYHNFEIRNMSQFFIIFAIVFPAFTGMTAGVGLSGDLKDPGKSIPIGTIAATLTGMIVYVLVAYKLSISASGIYLSNPDNQLVMGDVAIAGFIIMPIGLAASTFSSALGSVMVGPRTLQALAKDGIFPSKKINFLLSRERKSDGEPINASIFTCALAFVFVAIGEMNAVAKIISMFFMLTYGSLCLISFLNHFGSSPSYRPEFKSRWWISLIGFVASVWVMFKIDTPYAIASLVVLVIIYIYINSYHKDRRGLSSIFVNSISQLTRNLQLFFQKQSENKLFSDWRPSAICVSKHSFDRPNALRLLNWISYKYGFATYLHEIEGYYSKETAEMAKAEKLRLIDDEENKSSVFIETIISPSYTTAIAQAIQMPGVSGLENNMVLFEFEKNDINEIKLVVDNFNLVRAGEFDTLFLATSNKFFYPKGGIHIWINSSDKSNINLMVMLSFIILSHPDWKKSNIKVFVVTRGNDHLDFVDSFKDLVNSGRIPVMMRNVEFIRQDENTSYKDIVTQHSSSAALVMIGVNKELIDRNGTELFSGYSDIGDVLFVNANTEIKIE
ncbi:amino acid permease [Bacteroidales bacterium OttesenSCG-928-I21]|nr:amino acid permease [Bacteroidales bacterium OttesenSCG-928-I21]